MSEPSWRELRAGIVDALAGAGIGNAENEARFIVEEVSGSTGADWFEIADTVPREALAAKARAFGARRAAGEPLQYVLGAWSFRGIDVMVDPRVLIPRPETEWVVEVALEEAEALGLRRGPRRSLVAVDDVVANVVDLGTGSGVIALALERELPDVQVWATDASDEALAVASANIAGNAAARVRLANGSWFGALPESLRGTIPLVVSNPPYVAEHELGTMADEVVRYEPRTALVSGASGTEAIAEILREAPAWLAPTAAVVCEIGPTQGDATVALALDAGFAAALVRSDLAARPRVLIARWSGGR